MKIFGAQLSHCPDSPLATRLRNPIYIKSVYFEFEVGFAISYFARMNCFRRWKKISLLTIAT